MELMPVIYPPPWIHRMPGSFPACSFGRRMRSLSLPPGASIRRICVFSPGLRFFLCFDVSYRIQNIIRLFIRRPYQHPGDLSIVLISA